MTELDLDKYPFNLPLIKNLDSRQITREVTFLVGENGSGKSTLLEGIAAGSGLPVVEGEGRNKTAQKLADSLRLQWAINPHRGFFLTAEDFFGFIKQLKKRKSELLEKADELNQRFSGYGRDLAVGAIIGQVRATDKRYVGLETESHGEGFLDFFQSRLVPRGLYLLDEPEAALSPTSQLGLLSLIKEMINKECQFIIATHSPILMAYPQALIWMFKDDQISEETYDDVEHVRLTKAFLQNPALFIEKL